MHPAAPHATSSQDRTSTAPTGAGARGRCVGPVRRPTTPGATRPAAGGPTSAPVARCAELGAAAGGPERAAGVVARGSARAVAPAAGTDAGCSSSSLGAGFSVPSSTIIRTLDRRRGHRRSGPAPARRTRPTRSGSGDWVIRPPRWRGRVSRNRAPSPGAPEACSQPPCNRASSSEMARPSPVPPVCRCRDGSARQNRLKTSPASPGAARPRGR